jgi:hypothetical protein
VDGVIAADPVVLAYLPRATGPLPLISGEFLTGTRRCGQWVADAYALMVSTADEDRYLITMATKRRPALTSSRRGCDAGDAPLW